MNARRMLVYPALMLLSAGLAMGGSDRITAYDGTAHFVGFADPGSILCPGGEPTGLWPYGPPCSPGSRVAIRGMTMEYRDVTTDPRMTGDYVIVSNLNVDGWTMWGPGSGPMWGTITMRGDDGSVWEGSWTGKRWFTGNGPTSSLHAVVHCTDGKKAQYQVVFPPPGAPMVDGVIAGRIIEPGKK